MLETIKNNREEVKRIMKERLDLDKIKEGERRQVDKIVNMLLNIIEYSYLNKNNDINNGRMSDLHAIHATPQIVSNKANGLMEHIPFKAFQE